MSVDKYKFVSPGVFVSEIDNSQLPALPRGVGPVIIGRSLKGPSMRPVQVNSFSDFVETFGNPIFGGGDADVWRAGPNVSAPGYGTYAAQAYLRNESPLVFVRLAGIQDVNATTKDGKAGWEASGDDENASAMTGTGYGGGAFGLFISSNAGDVTSSATAIIGNIMTGSTSGSYPHFELTASTGTSYAFWPTGSVLASPTSEYPGHVGATDFEYDASGAPNEVAFNIASIINASASSDLFSASAESTWVVITSMEETPLGESAVLSSSLSASDNDPANFTVGGFFTPADAILDFSGSGFQYHSYTGSLAAIFYARTGSIGLSGTLADGATTATGTCGIFKSSVYNQFTAQIKDGDGNELEKVVFNFDENSKLFIRNVFNTNPTFMNDDPNVNDTALVTTKTYFLGESFERNITQLSPKTGDGDFDGSFAVVLGLASQSVHQHIQHTELKDAMTGWYFAQDLTAPSPSYSPLNMDKLFRFVGIGGGEWQQNNLKISISDITPSNNEANPFGYFTVTLRMLGDSDATPQVVETYSNVDLNPNSPNFIGRRIGDSYTTWDNSSKRYITYGKYVNQSRYVRVEYFGSVENDGPLDSKQLPFGVYGPTRWKGFSVLSGATDVKPFGSNDPAAAEFLHAYVLGGSDVPDSMAKSHGDFISVGDSVFTELTGAFNFPSVPTRGASNEGTIVNQKDAYFGATANMADSNRLAPSVKDMLRRKPDDTGVFTTIPDALEYSWVFSLDDIIVGSGGALGQWVSGSRATGDSITASGSYKDVLDAGFKQFTAVMSEGFEGLNIMEKEPFRNSLLPAGTTAQSSYTYASLDRAIDTVADAEVVEANMMSIPGLTTPALTTKLLDVCQARADALAVIDLPGGYIPPTDEADKSASARRGTVDDTIGQLNNRNLNNSYGCAYYPWVQVTDTVTTGGSLWVPPSVVVLGTFASSQSTSELWFAPAGFTRGGLTEGSAGLPVTNVRARLNSQERDDLYSANINPIAQFPAEGIVIFGQKTLQVTQSALDRINVRRLMIYVKREISRIAATLLFDQNVTATWNRFLGQVNPFLGSIQTRLGLTDYKVVLDDSTTTPDLVDRNILYAKIFLKPARAIEFIALDFIITRSGASFED